jgi:hypothetical protein
VRRQPFWACRCLRSELRRMILAFATRTACALGAGFLERVLVSATVVGIISNCVGACEPSAAGCTLMGPGDVGLRLGILDNARLASWFGVGKAPPRATGAPVVVRIKKVAEFLGC